MRRGMLLCQYLCLSSCELAVLTGQPEPAEFIQEAFEQNSSLTLVDFEIIMTYTSRSSVVSMDRPHQELEYVQQECIDI